ncbi:hypothetical protein [Tomitella gaofuii]|uniref:hypothetical protein n=1 Tax=Tomitella gaofuii TaxID=2760083 RepID=UPI0015F9239F|nr:hypothetical protein [Tomitella gaofuii]
MSTRIESVERIEWVVRVAGGDVCRNCAGVEFTPEKVQWVAFRLRSDDLAVHVTAIGKTADGDATNTTFFSADEVPSWVPFPPAWFPVAVPA